MVFPQLKLGSKILLTNLGFFSPFELNFAVTYKCNSRCKTCSIWKVNPRNELSLEEIRKFTKNIDFIHWVRLTGGEPFLRNDYVEIVKTLYENVPDLFMVTTPTNGLLPDLIFDMVRKILGFFEKKYIITVSLDGTKTIHDRIRGVKKSWDKSIETYTKLKELEELFDNFNVFFGYTISPFNVGFFRQTVKEVRKTIPEIRVNDFHVNLFQVSDIYYKNEDQKVSEEFLKKAKSEIETILKLRENTVNPIDLIETKYLELGEKYLETQQIPINCNVFNLSCFIDPNGNVYPCTIFNRKLGNLRDGNYDLKKILQSEKAKAVKKEIVEKRCPQCWTPCEAHQIILSNIGSIMV